MKVTIFRDYPEEGFPSMEVYADNLLSAISNQPFRRNLAKQASVISKNIRIHAYLPLAFLSKKLGYYNLKTRFIFRYFIYSILAPFHQEDINHVIDQSYGHLVYFLNPKKTIVTVHDLDVLRLKFLKWRTLRDKAIKFSYLWSVNGLKRAAKIIAVSQDTKNDLVRLLKIPSEKVVVIAEGVEPIFKKIKNKRELERAKKKYHLPDKYLLHIGECWQYKNIEGILKAFKQLTKKRGLKNLFFVKVGGTWTREQKSLIRRLKIDDRVIKLPFVPREDLPAIYNLAKALVQLSHLEGFGLTVLEAMACGCPVVVSNIPALKELVNNAGIIVNPRDIEKVVNSIASLLNDKTKSYRYSLAGLKRAKLFNWQKTAKKTIRVYEEIFQS